MNTIKLSTIILILTFCRNEAPIVAENTPEFVPLLAWLQKVELERHGKLGSDDLCSLRKIRLDGSERPGQIDPLADEGKLQKLSKLPALKSLSIWTTRFSNDGLAIIGVFHSLEDLEIGGWDVRYDDQGLSSLKKLSHIKRLKLVQAQGITDAGMGVLSEFPALTDLDIPIQELPMTGWPSLPGQGPLKWFPSGGRQNQSAGWGHSRTAESAILSNSNDTRSRNPIDETCK